jgi:genome maintenance exonuclease 1
MKIFEHVDLNLPKIDRVTIDGVRYYRKPNSDDKLNFVSITSVTSHYNKEKFSEWRKRVGEEEANRITKAATDRGTGTHTLIEAYTKNEPLPKAPALHKHLFNVAKPALDRIGTIYGIELGMYSEYLKIAGTCDLVANFDEKLSIVDYKTSAQIKPRHWIDSYFVQAAGYAFMLKELTGMNPEQLVIIMAAEDGELEVFIETDIKKYIVELVKYIKKFMEDNVNG